MTAIMGFAPYKLVTAVLGTCLALYFLFAMGPTRPNFTLPKMPGRFAHKTGKEVPKALRDISNNTLGVRFGPLSPSNVWDR